MVLPTWPISECNVPPESRSMHGCQNLIFAFILLFIYFVIKADFLRICYICWMRPQPLPLLDLKCQNIEKQDMCSKVIRNDQDSTPTGHSLWVLITKQREGKLINIRLGRSQDFYFLSGAGKKFYYYVRLAGCGLP